MQLRSEAEENLRIIRSLLERSTIYRAISAPTALVGGILSILAAALLHCCGRRDPALTSPFGQSFAMTWMLVLAGTIAANTFFLWYDARKRGEQFLSAGMRLALRALTPGMLGGLFFTAAVWIHYPDLFWLLPPIWMLCYGVALLATAHFAPRSIAWLGWSFLFTGFFVCYRMFFAIEAGSAQGATFSNLAMGLTFGVFHLIYAAFTWPRGTSQPNNSVAGP